MREKWKSFRHRWMKVDMPKTVSVSSAATVKAAQAATDEVTSVSRRQMLREIHEAKVQWQIACKKLDYVLEKDQIDYAIFALEAAEKRYEMLLRQAKKMKLSAIDERGGEWAVRSNGLDI